MRFVDPFEVNRGKTLKICKPEICKDCWHPFECCRYGETPEKCFKYQKEQKPNKK